MKKIQKNVILPWERYVHLRRHEKAANTCEKPDIIEKDTNNIEEERNLPPSSQHLINDTFKKEMSTSSTIISNELASSLNKDVPKAATPFLAEQSEITADTCTDIEPFSVGPPAPPSKERLEELCNTDFGDCEEKPDIIPTPKKTKIKWLHIKTYF
jgi:hypothetical protein